MKKNILIGLLGGFISLSYAEAPVIDNSEQYKALQLAQSASKHTPYDLDELKNQDEPPSTDEAYNEAPQSQDEKMQVLLSKIDAMQHEIASLRGQIEVQAHQLGQLAGQRDGQQQLARVDRQAESNKLEKQTVATEQSQNTPQPKVVSSKDPVEEQLSYVGAFELVKTRQYEKAIPAMQQFLSQYPQGPYAANAHYWLGELLLLKKDLTGAVKEFKTVVEDFSDSNKLAAAKFKLGVTYIRLGENDKGRVELQHVREQFPNTSAARLAKAKLDDL